MNSVFSVFIISPICMEYTGPVAVYWVWAETPALANRVLSEIILDKSCPSYPVTLGCPCMKENFSSIWNCQQSLTVFELVTRIQGW
jgi:hypothetical protein